MEKRRRSFEQQQRVDQQNRYDEIHTEQVKLKLNRKTDADILNWVYAQHRSLNATVQGEIKRLIRQEIARTSRDSVGVHRQDSGT